MFINEMTVNHHQKLIKSKVINNKVKSKIKILDN